MALLWPPVQPPCERGARLQACGHDECNARKGAVRVTSREKLVGLCGNRASVHCAPPWLRQGELMSHRRNDAPQPKTCGYTTQRPAQRGLDAKALLRMAQDGWDGSGWLRMAQPRRQLHPSCRVACVMLSLSASCYAQLDVCYRRSDTSVTQSPVPISTSKQTPAHLATPAGGDRFQK